MKVALTGAAGFTGVTAQIAEDLGLAGSPVLGPAHGPSTAGCRMRGTAPAST